MNIISITKKYSFFSISNLILTICINSHIGFTLCYGQSIQAKFHQAQDAYYSLEPQKAFKIYDSIWSNNKNLDIDEKIRAGRNLAKMSWMLYDDIEEALLIISQLEVLNYNLPNTLILKARILENEKRFPEAIETLSKSIEISDSNTDTYNSLIAYLSLVLKLNLNDDDLKWDFLINDAYERAKKFNNQNNGDATVSYISLGFNLLKGDGINAFKSWMSYYRKVNINQVDESLIEDISKFKNALDVDDLNKSSTSELETIILGLAESGFIGFSELVKSRYLIPKKSSLNPKIVEIELLNEFLKDCQELTIKHYKDTPKAQVNRTKYFNEFVPEYWESIYSLGKEFWKKLGMNESNFSKENFHQMLNDKFKTELYFLWADNINGLHLGQIIKKTKLTISQHGRSSIFSYLVIDHALSNGFWQWYTDGRMQVGGWQKNDYFVQVRSGHTLTKPISIWTMLTDKETYNRTLNDIESKDEIDFENAKRNPFKITNAIEKRIWIQEYGEILDSLKTVYKDNSLLRLAFISEVERLILESNIYAHEGRHGIDRKMGIRDGRTLEYRAKLSEIYFTSRPKLGLANILVGTKDTSSSHGWANVKLAEGIIEWMKKHQNEVYELDIDKPILPQAYKLTDKQLKQLVYQLDPITKK